MPKAVPARRLSNRWRGRSVSRSTCIVEPRRGQTYAYNRAFAHACRTTPAPEYVAVLDDDEYPDRNWLTEMIRVAGEYGADIVGGPVFPVFDNPDHWLAKSGFYAPSRNATGPVPMIYGAGNMLIRRSVLEQYLDEPFAHAYAFTGGSDYDFFWRCRNDGRSFAWADDAHVFETTPPSRTTVGYVLRRKFRNGTEATRLERKFLRNARRHAAPLVHRPWPARPRRCLAAAGRATRPPRHHVRASVAPRAAPAASPRNSICTTSNIAEPRTVGAA